MSDFGRFWALKIRGCTIAEHAVAHRLGDRHNAKTGRCFPGRLGISFELECSRTYLTQIQQSLEQKKFIERVKRFEPIYGSQTSNDFRLNFSRWFPFHSDEVEREEKRLLAYFRHAVESPELAQGFLSIWLEKPYFPDKQPDKKKKLKNGFKKEGRNTRSHRRRPISTVLWIAVASEGHERHLHWHLPDIMTEIEKDTGHRFHVEILRTWLKASD